LISGDELAYFVDLQLFLGNSLKKMPLKGRLEDWHNVIGEVNN